MPTPLPPGTNLQLVEDADSDQEVFPAPQPGNSETVENASSEISHSSRYPQRTNRRRPMRYRDGEE